MTMAAWQVQEMYEAESARIWEDLNAPDPYEKLLIRAGKRLKTAISKLELAISDVMDASSELQDIPEGDKVESYVTSLEEIECDLKKLKDLYLRGVRE